MTSMQELINQGMDPYEAMKRVTELGAQNVQTLAPLPNLGPTPAAQQLGASVIGGLINQGTITPQQVQQNAQAQGIDLATQFGQNPVSGLYQPPPPMPPPPLDMGSAGQMTTTREPFQPPPPVNVMPRQPLPNVPQFAPGNFSDFLGQNPINTLTPQQMAEQAARLRAMQIDPQRSQVEANRQALAERAALAVQQAGAGRDTALRNIQENEDAAMRQAMARAIRSNLVSSNIPETTDFRPIANRGQDLRADVEGQIANRIAQISLEAMLGDQDAARMLADLERMGGQLEASTLFDLMNQERMFGETARGNRFNEFIGLENLNLNAMQGNFQNQALMSQLQEAMRQNDLTGARADLDQYLREWTANQNANIGWANFDLNQLGTFNQLANSDLARQLSQFELSQMQNPNSLPNMLTQAQIQNLLSQATARGETPPPGLSPQDQFNALNNMMPLLNMLSNPETRGQVEGMVPILRWQYDSVMGQGAFDRDYGATVTPPPPMKPPNVTPAIWDKQVQQARDDIAKLEKEIGDLEAQYDKFPTSVAGLPGIAPRATLERQIATKLAEIDRIKEKFGIQ